MQKQEVITTLTNMGWKQDRYGHFKSHSGKVRCKIQERSLRIERLYVPQAIGTYTPPKDWLNIASDYFCNLKTKEGRLVIKGKVLKCQP